MNGQTIRYAWIDEVTSGAVDPKALMNTSSQHSFTDELVAEIHAKAAERPGVPLVVSAHSSHGAATFTRLKRLGQERWQSDRFIMKTRTLGRPGQSDRLSVITITLPRGRA